MVTLFQLPNRCAGRGPRLITDPLSPEDAPRILDHFRALSPLDRALRFRREQADDAWVDRYVVELDFARQTLLGISAADGTVVALLQVCRFRYGGRASAELAFSVHPLWRGCGLAHRLMRLALAHARTCGLGLLIANVAPHNSAMHAVLAACGMRFTQEEGDLVGALEVAQGGIPLAA
jgi:RimJ/RimL family protein N-acetyltransferase